MKMYLLLLVSLIAISESVSAMQKAIENFEKEIKEEENLKIDLSDETKQLKKQLRDCSLENPNKECLDVYAETVDSLTHDIKGIKQCGDLLPLTFTIIDDRCREIKDNNLKKCNCVITALFSKLELLKLCAKAQVNENKK